MAQEIRSFSITIPAGTAIATPQVTQMSMPARNVDEVEVEVPPGPRGEVGFTLGSSGVQVIPIQLGSWIVTDNYTLNWRLEGFWDSGSWELRAYNTGSFDHTLSVRFLLSLVVKGAASSAPATIPAEQLGAVPVASQIAIPAVAVPLLVPPPLPLPPLPAVPPTP